MARPTDALVKKLEALPQTVLVGVSGGVDSMAMLCALQMAGKKPVVLHFDHLWRRSGAQDKRLVCRYAEQLGCKCRTGRARANLPRTEAAARQERWRFFERVSRQSGIRDLVLAHNADDHVETFLLQLLRGGGSAARGMEPERVRHGMRVHRPWLDVWRTEILAFARTNKLEWKEDPSNKDTAYMRNRVRRRLVPYLEKNFFPQARHTLWRAAQIQQAQHEWVEAVCRPYAAQGRLPVKQLRQMPVAQTRFILRAWLQRLGIADIGFRQIEAARGLLTDLKVAKINLPGNRFVRRRAGWLFVQ